MGCFGQTHGRLQESIKKRGDALRQSDGRFSPRSTKAAQSTDSASALLFFLLLGFFWRINSGQRREFRRGARVQLCRGVQRGLFFTSD